MANVSEKDRREWDIQTHQEKVVMHGGIGDWQCSMQVGDIYTDRHTNK